MTNEEAFQAIRIRRQVPSFVNYLRTMRPTASRQLVYDAFGRRSDAQTLTLVWVRSQAVQFAQHLGFHEISKRSAMSSKGAA